MKKKQNYWKNNINSGVSPIVCMFSMRGAVTGTRISIGLYVASGPSQNVYLSRMGRSVFGRHAAVAHTKHSFEIYCV